MENVTKDAILSEAARILQARRKTRGGGRPRVMSGCPKCGRLFSAREMIKHKAQCK